MLKVSTFPHQFPFETSQVGVGAGGAGLGLVVAGAVVGLEVADAEGAGVVLSVGALDDFVEILGVGTLDDALVGTDVGLLAGEAIGFDVGLGLLDEEDESLKERYQFVRSVSPRQSPTVTPFQPLALIRSK